jgi:hypothetical protein
MNCAGCLHRNRDQLDAQLIQGIPYRTISETFHLSLGAVSRHRKHVREMIQARGESETAAHGSALYDRVEKLVGEAEAILEAAKAKKDFRGANGALGAACKLLDLLGRASGQLQAANAGGIHLTLNQRVTNTVINNYDMDVEFAMLVSEATRNFDPVEIGRLKALADSSSVQHACNDLPIALNPKP